MSKTTKYYVHPDVHEKAVRQRDKLLEAAKRAEVFLNQDAYLDADGTDEVVIPLALAIAECEGGEG